MVTRLLILVSLVILATISLIVYRLPPSTLNFIALTLLSLFVLSAISMLVFSGLWAKEHYLHKRADRKKAELQANLITSNNEVWVREFIDGRVEYARLGGLRLRVNSHDHEPTKSEILFAQTQLTNQQSKLITSGQLPMLPPTTQDLLPLLDKAERVLVKGASDAGKTTLLQHIASRSKGVWIIDPHYAPGIWPTPHIIGAKRNFTAIDSFLLRLMEEMQKRYNQRGDGKIDFEPITLIIDEYQSIRAECNNAPKILSTLIRESRKVGFRLFIGSHSELVKPLGLEGQGDIRDGLFVVRLTIDQTNKQRQVTIDRGNGEKQCYIPPFNGATIQQAIIPDLVIRPTKEEDNVLRLIEAGVTSRKQISESTWGKGKYGKYYNEKIIAILVKYGLEELVKEE